MNSCTKRVIEHCTNALNYGQVSLARIVGRLGEVGIESCHIDYRIPALIFYVPEGDSYSLPLPTPGEERIANSFDCPALQRALEAASSGDLGFPEFKHCTQEAGCIGFFIWLDGWHATFLGRHGEIHDVPLAGRGRVSLGY